MTTYDLFIHYYNDDIGKAVTNETSTKWYPAHTTIRDYYGDNYNEEDANKYLSEDRMDANKIKHDEECLEYIHISKSNTTSDDNTSSYEKYVISSATINNPKYDMIFIWDGLGYMVSSVANEEYNQLYYDKMKRVPFKPWFFHSVYHSLTAVMINAQKLVDLFGKEHIMIGKEVNLTQYIEIV